MSSYKVMITESTPIMPPGGASGGSCSSPAAAATIELPVAPTIATKGDNEESMWESDWVSVWESDWESRGVKDSLLKRVEIIQSDDSEPKVKRLKSMKTLTDDVRISPAKDERRGSSPASDDDVIELEDDTTDSEEDDSFNSEEAALDPRFACHCCKLRNAKQKVQCCQCPIRLCGMCLQNRNGEKLEVETQEGVKWVCPKCRVGCGPGCNSCCTCAPCRKSRGLPPTGQLIRLARATGFDNVHDYLIHRETGESAEKITKRKEGRGWTKAGGAKSSRSTGATVRILKPAQFWADCVPANEQTTQKIAERKEGRGWTKAVGGAMCSRSKAATVGILKPAQFWADCPTNRATVEFDNQQTSEKIGKGKEGGGGIQAGGVPIGSCSTGATVGMLKPALFWADCPPANRATVELNNQQTRQKKGLTWTLPKAVGDIWKSTNNNVKREDGERGDAVLPSGDIKTVPSSVSDVSKSNNDEHERAVIVKKKVLDQVLGREAQKSVRNSLSLDQILHRLFHAEDQAGQDRSRPLYGSIQQMKRNRKHRKMGIILEPSMFKTRKSKSDDAAKITKATPGFPRTFKMEDVHRDLSSRAANIMPAERQLTFQPAGQNAHDGRRRHQDRHSDTPIPLKRPVTSLQALRKMGILAKRNNHASIDAVQESAQKQGLAMAPPLVDHSLDQSLKQSFQVVGTSSRVVPPSRSGSKAILMRHLEKRKKIECRSCLKSQNTTPALPSASDKTFVTEIAAAWRGELVRPRETKPQSGLGHFSQTIISATTGCELKASRHSGLHSGFESFGHKDTVIGFGSFRGEEAAN